MHDGWRYEPMVEGMNLWLKTKHEHSNLLASMAPIPMLPNDPVP